MTKIPHARDVRQAIRAVRAALRRTQKALNQVASQQMAKGNYAAAEGLIVKGKDIKQFDTEVVALGGRWREVCEQGSRETKKPATPLWEYYQPILQALNNLGGAAPRSDLELGVERVMASSLLAGDRAAMSRGRERWRVMVQRARKPMIAEGWIEAGRGLAWRITEAGRQAAQKPTKNIRN